ncbi:MAG: hypothetical protein ACI4FV_04320 [Lachnospiraceae bacterium]
MMALQMILCMETNKSAATDYIYIRDTINRFYMCNNKIRITPIYMNSKSRYRSKNVKLQIQRFIKDFTIGETKVIYCIDTDSYEVDMNHAKELEELERYCDANGYDLIWFCHDVEEVYIGKRISDKQKVAEATIFRRMNKMQTVPEEKLSNGCKRKGVSNILLVLDKYLCRK